MADRKPPQYNKMSVTLNGMQAHERQSDHEKYTFVFVDVISSKDWQHAECLRSPKGALELASHRLEAARAKVQSPRVLSMRSTCPLENALYLPDVDCKPDITFAQQRRMW